MPLIPLFDPPPPPQKHCMTIIVNFSLDYPEEIRRTGYANYFGSNVQVVYYGQEENGKIKLVLIFSMSVLGGIPGGEFSSKAL